jgi:hypothetical protein
MLALRRRKLAEEVEREASAAFASGEDLDVLAWQRLNQLLNGRADEDR